MAACSILLTMKFNSEIAESTDYLGTTRMKIKK